MADWEWVCVGRGGSKSIGFASVLPGGSDDYGGSFPNDNETPVLSRQFEAENAPEEVVDDMEELFITKKGTATLLGYTGYVTAFSGTLAAKGANKWNVTATLAKPIVDLSS